MVRIQHSQSFFWILLSPRMEKARQEANEAFKNISVGQKRKASITEKKTETHDPVTAKRRLTRLERCKLEAQQAFGNAPLGTLAENVEKKNNGKRNRPGTGTKRSGVENIQTVPKNTKKSFERRSTERSMKEKRKSISKGRQNRRSSSSRRRSTAMMQRRSSTKSNRLTKVQASQLETLKSFGGQSLENLCTYNKASVAEVKAVTVTADDNCEIQNELKEPVAMITHDGNDSSSCQQDGGMDVEPAQTEKDVKDLGEVSPQKCHLVDEGTQVGGPSDTEMHTEDFESNIVDQTTDVQVQNLTIISETPQVQTHENHVHSIKEMTPIPEQSPPEASTQASATQANSITPVAEPKPLTRLEKARLEALQSFNGQAFDHVIKTSTRKMARYLTPVKHQGTNTEVHPTRNTPSQTEDSYGKRHPLPNKSFYSNLRDNSFCDSGALLESSKKVVQTARSLDTPSPDCSLANTKSSTNTSSVI